MKNLLLIIGCVLGFIVICGAFLNTIIQLIESVAGIAIYLAYFFAIGIIYEIITRTYRLVKRMLKK